MRTASIGKILDAALKLMAKNGYEGTSISQIAKEAGVSKGLMYNYFDSKLDLLKTIVTRAMEEGDRLMETILAKKPAETMENIFRWFFYELRENADRWRLFTELTLKIDQFDFVQEIARVKMTDYVNILAGLLAEMGYDNPSKEAKVIAGLFDGIGIQSLIIKDDYPLNEMEEFLINKYCKHE